MCSYFIGVDVIIVFSGVDGGHEIGIRGCVPFEPRPGARMQVDWNDGDNTVHDLELTIAGIRWDATDREFIGSFKNNEVYLNEENVSAEKYLEGLRSALTHAGFGVT